MTKCPCEKCIVLAMCKGNEISSLILKCDMLLDYIQSMNCAKTAIETIVPHYYDLGKETIKRSSHHIRMRVREIKHSRDPNYKRKV